MKSYLLACAVFLCAAVQAQIRKEIIYVGTYSIRESKGIYVFELNRSNGSLKLIQTIDDLSSPTYLEIHPSGRFLYAVNRGPINKGESFGSATAYAIDPQTGKLEFINHVSSYGKDPCHISFDKSGNWAFVSNYSEGNFIVLPVFEDGSLGAPSDSKKYSGKSVNRLRQDQPHIHSAEVSKDNRFVYVSDLGTDKVYTYAIDTLNGKVNATGFFETPVTAGSGPRHLAIHPEGRWAYSAEELSSTVGIFEIESLTGALKLVRDTVPALPAGTKEINTSADIHTDPFGKFLYVSQRGFDGLTIYSIMPDGNIRLAGHQKSMGKTPRNFLVDAKGKYVWIANQDTDNITVFRVNPKTGLLTYSNIQVAVPSPVCIKQLQLK
jgi:6-phosphogluconolactonase